MQKRILLAGVFLFIPIVSLAALRPVFTLSSGFANANMRSSTSINFGSFQNSYVGGSHSDTDFDSGLFLGGEALLLQNWSGQIGLSYFQNSPFVESGTVYQFSDPAFNNLNYQYQIISRRISIDAKLLYAFCQIWHPYLAVSLGEAFNKAYNYTETPASTADVSLTPPFGNHTTNAFSYSLGLGIDLDITNHWRLGLGYRFVDLGSASLGVTPSQIGTHTISNTPIYVNEVLLRISFLG